jgi:hypothetical protein
MPQTTIKMTDFVLGLLFHPTTKHTLLKLSVVLLHSHVTLF